jgi:hypothetical protein
MPRRLEAGGCRAIMMLALYLGQWAMVTLALATAAISWPQAFGMRVLPRAIVAAAMTPHVLALLVLLIPLVWPGAPGMAFLVLPAILSIATLAVLRRSLLEMAGRMLRLSRRWGRNPHAIIVGLGVAAVAAILIQLTVVNTTGPATGHDIQVYLSEAKVFAENRTLASIPDFHAEPGEVAKTHPHQFLWQAYLAQALMATDGAIGFPDDLTARVALHLPFLILGVMAIALSLVAVPGWTAVLALPLLLFVEPLHLVLNSFSVDAFRTLPLLALVALLLTTIGRRGELPWSRFFLIGTAAAFTAASHTVNVAFLIILYVSLPLLWAAQRIAFASMWRIGVVSLLLSSTTIIYYLDNWMQYGTPFGFGFAYIVYRGTPLWEAFSESGRWTKHEGLVSAVIDLAKAYGPGLTAAAILSALILLVLSIRWRLVRRIGALGVMFTTLVAVSLLPIYGEVSLQGALLSNSRYGLSIFALAPVLIASGIGLALHACGRAIRPLRLWPAIPTALVALPLAYKAVGEARNWSLHSPEFQIQYLQSNEALMASLADSLPEGAHWIASRFTPTYIAKRKPIYLYGIRGSALLHAETKVEVERILDEMNVRMVALYFFREDWYPRTDLYRALSQRTDIKPIISGYWHVYILPSDAQGWQQSSHGKKGVRSGASVIHAPPCASVSGRV